MILAAEGEGLDRAEVALRAGELVVVPTDTVYGIAALPRALPRLLRAKGRPASIPIAVLVGVPSDAEHLWRAPVPQPATALARAHWPGPLTIVVARAPGWGSALGDTVGVRCPDHEWLRALCRRVGPIATTSANLHGEPTPASARAVAAIFGDAVLVIDGGRCEGLPSTVVDCTADPCRVLRPGRLSSADLGLSES